MSALILVVEDDPDVQELIVVNLLRAGHRVERASDAEAAQALMHKSMPDLVLLDWMLPGISGVDFAKRLRSEPRTRVVSIILLTARSEERDKITGLEFGADDYITKPFSPRELLARISAVLRRRVPQATEDVVDIEGLRLNPAAQRVSAGGEDLALGPTEFRLLHFLMTHSDRIYTRPQLLNHVWGDHFFGDERTVDVHVRRLRVALEKTGHDKLIQTLRGSGYSLSAKRR